MSVWALGFMFAVENWPEDCACPRGNEASKQSHNALDGIVTPAEDGTGKSEGCMHDEDGASGTSQARVQAFGEATWAVYDRRELWKRMGQRV